MSNTLNNIEGAQTADDCTRLGGRTLFLMNPHLRGEDVRQLQCALSAMGFYCDAIDGIFGAHTEEAVRAFQVNYDLYTDGIVGEKTVEAIVDLRFTWEGKETLSFTQRCGFARASEVLECRRLCLFGTDNFTREVAKRISNLALATNPASKITSADSLKVSPDASMLLVRIALPEASADDTTPLVAYGEGPDFAAHLAEALRRLRGARQTRARLVIMLPSQTWQDAGENRSAQHFAITVLDALCTALEDVF